MADDFTLPAAQPAPKRMRRKTVVVAVAQGEKPLTVLNASMSQAMKDYVAEVDGSLRVEFDWTED